VSSPDELTTRYRRVIDLTRTAAVAALASWWDAVDTDDPESFARLAPGAVAVLTAAQVRVAATAPRFLAASLTAQGVPSSVQPLDPSAFAGRALDGRPLTGHLWVGVQETQRRVGLGEKLDTARQSGFARIGRAVVTEIADAGRESLAASMTLDRNVEGYYREVRLPACGRCLVLAGRRYRLDASFSRHPRCDCVPLPLGRKLRSEVPDARELFERMTPAEQEASLGKARAQLVRDGEDLSRAVNRDLRHGGAPTPKPVPLDGAKPTPLALRQQSRGDGEKYRQLMAREGYLTAP
jgi:hypothetical protein